MSLQDVIKKIENDRGIGVFSKSNKTMDGKHTYQISFKLKPSQQVLAQLGSIQDKTNPLLTTKGTIKASGNPDISVTSFAPEKSKNKLTIAGTAIDKLLSSARIYVNTHLFPAGYYERVIQEHLTTKEDLPEENKGIDWENLAVGICHAQETHLLVDTVASDSHPARAHTTVLPDGTSITENTPALLLLSNPILNLSKTHTKALKTEEEQIKFIAGMYRNLFHATTSQGRNYIVMPAAGLGGHGGTPKTYFKALMTVAQEYPDLNIIYNAGDHEKTFDKVLKKGFKDEVFKNNKKPINVVRTTKNIIFVAAQLTSHNQLCAIHNPSSSNVVYGKSDVGEHWQSADTELRNIFGKNPGKTLQAYIGTISTAPLGSYGVNPEAFSRIEENDLDNTIVLNRSRTNSTANNTPVDSTHASKTEEDNDSKKRPTPPQSKTSPEAPVVMKPATEDIPKQTQEPSTQVPPPPRQEDTPKKADKSSQDVPAATDKTSTTDQSSTSGKISGPGSSGIFPPSPKQEPNKSATDKTTERKSALTEEQLKEIRKTIDQLTGEMQSYWPYPNKDVKQIKINALNALIINAQKMTITEAVTAVKADYPRATEGRISMRTADLLHKLENSPANKVQL